MPKTIAILGALDTKGLEFSFLKTEIKKRIVIDSLTECSASHEGKVQ